MEANIPDQNEVERWVGAVLAGRGSEFWKGVSLNELALFAGAGGGLLASRLLGWRTVCAVELSEYRRNILKQRQEDGHFEQFAIESDVTTFDGTAWRGRCDIVTGGPPCRRFSKAAGAHIGKSVNLFPSMLRIIHEARPRYILMENSPALLANEYFGQLLAELAAMGFHARWGVFSACAAGAPHTRERLFIVCHAHSVGPQTGSWIEEWPRPAARTWWTAEPGIRRVAYGVADRVDRISAIGDGQVPAVVVRAWHELV